MTRGLFGAERPTWSAATREPLATDRTVGEFSPIIGITQDAQVRGFQKWKQLSRFRGAVEALTKVEDFQHAAHGGARAYVYALGRSW